MYIASYASRELRCFVQILDFEQISHFRLYEIDNTSLYSSVDSEIRDEVFNAPWFLSCANLFPSLRALIMDNLPLALSTNCDSRYLNLTDPLVLFNETSPIGPMVKRTKQCPQLFSLNTDCHLRPFKTIGHHSIMYLDLSWSEPELPSKLGDVRLPNLRVLKLRGCGLHFEEVRMWLQDSAPYIWLLDVRDNYLDDRSVEYLLRNLLMAPLPRPHQAPHDEPWDRFIFGETPRYTRTVQEEVRLDSVVPLRPSEKRPFLDCFLSHGGIYEVSDSDRIFHDVSNVLLRHTGLTHLFISGNQLSSSGLRSLLTDTNRFQVLDVGTTEHNVHHDPVEGSRSPGYRLLGIPDMRAIGGLSRGTSTQMEILRVHHSLITLVPTMMSLRSLTDAFTLAGVKEAENIAAADEIHIPSDKPPSPTNPGASYGPFSPLDNFRLRELTLTSLPSKTYGITMERLVQFLEDCAAQEAIINEARASIHYGRRSPPLLSGLRVLRLELLPEDHVSQFSNLSISEDPDAENFHASSSNDFSFFDNHKTASSSARRDSEATTKSRKGKEGEVAGSPIREKAGSGKSKMPWEGTTQDFLDYALSDTPPAYDASRDVRSALIEWRERNPGRWTGKIEIIQMPLKKD
jgi:hypothetical protein